MAVDKIKVLPIEVANRIAAGEVVERPASVLKELLENALDAGASRIDVNIEGAGSGLIRVLDNGRGMGPQDLALCLERHATSKLSTADDLERIVSLGFRGEALPSIASVSRLRIRSRLPEASQGWEINEAKQLVEAGSASGTLVEVKDLFFNIPARRKFLKSPATEGAHLATALIRLALARPEVAFYYAVNGQSLYQLPANADLRARVGALLGRDVLGHLLGVDQQVGPLRISGLTSLPSLSKPNGDQVYTYINGRFVRDKVLMHAISHAYHELMPPNRRPVAILHISLDPSLVDVNVHPAKIEVRFRDSSVIHQALSRALRASLNQGPDAWPTSASADEPLPQLRENSSFSEAVSPKSSSNNFNYPPANYASSVGRSYSQTGSKRSWAATVQNKASNNLAAAPPSFKAVPMFQPVRDVRALAQLHNLFILAAHADGLLIVDQHAAHERLNYEQIKQAMAQGEATGQALLSPQPLNFSPVESALAQEAASLWLRMGLELVPFGPNSWAVQAVPAHWAGRDVGPLVSQLLAEMAVIAPETPEFVEKSLRTLACHSSVLQGMRLALPAMQNLLDRLFELPPPLTCPHGRPVVLTISAQELMRAFQRT